jgi:branched-chain amino acid transport system ATP-binding protein
MAIIGPNGAGKSTLFNLITGHIAPSSGQVFHKGTDITAAPPHRICRRGIGRSIQHTNIFPGLTVFECLQAAFIAHHGRGRDFWGRADRLYRAETEALLERLGLADKAGEVAGALAPGTQTQIGIALASDPDILLLTSDRRHVGGRPGDPAPPEHARARGRCCSSPSTHGGCPARRAHRVLHQPPVALGTPDEIRADAEVRRVYLGGH